MILVCGNENDGTCDQCKKELHPEDAWCVTNSQYHRHAHQMCVRALEADLAKP